MEKSVIEQLKELHGTYGHVGDVEFTTITKLLEGDDRCAVQVVTEEETEGSARILNLSHTVYSVAEGPEVRLFALWFQVRTQNAPKGLDLAFGFDEVYEMEIPSPTEVYPYG